MAYDSSSVWRSVVRWCSTVCCRDTRYSRSRTDLACSDWCNNRVDTCSWPRFRTSGSSYSQLCCRPVALTGIRLLQSTQSTLVGYTYIPVSAATHAVWLLAPAPWLHTSSGFICCQSSHHYCISSALSRRHLWLIRDSKKWRVSA